MKQIKWTVAILTVLPLLVLFQNCGQKFASSASSSSLSFCEPSNKATPSPYYSSKVMIPNRVVSAQQKLTTEASPLSLIVDVVCMNDSDEDHHFFKRKINLSKKQKTFRKAALTVAVGESYSLPEIEAELERDPCFLAITENLKVRKEQVVGTAEVNDPQASEQGHLGFVNHAESMTLQSEINRKVVVAFVDTGIDYNHPEMSPRMWTNASGRYGYNFIDNNELPLDDDGHGTHVAGIVAAVENNGFGVAGLTGDYVEMMAVKTLNARGDGNSQTVYDGIQYAITNGADIINLSIEAEGRNPLMEAAINDAIRAGIIVTAATGNSSNEILSSRLYAPAYIGPSLKGILSVASVDTRSAGLSLFSNYSSTYAEISGPGAENSANIDGGILSVVRNGSWGRIRGTSQATPMVTSAAAMVIGYLKTKNVKYTPAGIESFLLSDGVMVNPNLTPFVRNGAIINLGFLAQNLEDYFTRPQSADDTVFNGDETTGNTCVLR